MGNPPVTTNGAVRATLLRTVTAPNRETRVISGAFTLVA
jgi:hypothetical protein